jgi:thiamine-monophosphate kinase
MRRDATSKPIGEFELIERFFHRASTDADVLLGIGDDAAIVTCSQPLVIATDTLVERTHFLAGTPAATIAYRAVAVNLSDMAAMGALPRWFTLALTIETADPAWLTEFSDALAAAAEPYALTLIGGDTTRGPLTVTLQLIGTVEGGRALRRSGASPGEDVYVTGQLGDAAAGLAILKRAGRGADDAERYLIERFERPTARVAEGRALRDVATAAIDVSDGLVADLGHVCAASGCGAVIDNEALPLSAALGESVPPDTARGYALYGGDDYELCFTARPEDEARVAAALQATATVATKIGRTVPGSGVVCRQGGELVVPERSGYAHF